ncbi:hypothetical protein Poli38472_007435 [Pythium oligandrum]|uniref:Uncharacterized protein n=1 Tax=Pythium oligandrum TaxID=41045 RepID=A0A8K1CT10_PYTOL|nr:hypothetical protein Poli38472_007435 [Pythium oligandrum]|eukprot:TMW67763.1 hypothetical protein Poli38472_007435 [Pythium oligandrum]
MPRPPRALRSLRFTQRRTDPGASVSAPLPTFTGSCTTVGDENECAGCAAKQQCLCDDVIMRRAYLRVRSALRNVVHDYVCPFRPRPPTAAEATTTHDTGGEESETTSTRVPASKTTSIGVPEPFTEGREKPVEVTPNDDTFKHLQDELRTLLTRASQLHSHFEALIVQNQALRPMVKGAKERMIHRLQHARYRYIIYKIRLDEECSKEDVELRRATPCAHCAAKRAKRAALEAPVNRLNRSTRIYAASSFLVA